MEAARRASSVRSEAFHISAIALAILYLAGSASAAGFSEALWVKATLGTSNDERGLYLLDLPDGRSEPAEVGGRDCRRLIGDSTGGEGYLYFDVDDSYIMNDAIDVFVTVEHFDGPNGSFSLQYDDGKSPYADGGSVELQGTSSWRKHSFFLPVVGFTNGQFGNADFRIAVSDVNGTDLYVRSVSVTRAPGPYIRPKTTTFEADTFASSDRLVFTFYFYWYDIYSGAHIWDDAAHTDDALQDHPPTLEDFSFKSVAWHRRQLLDMIEAGVDVAMPVYWGASAMMEGWSVEGIKRLVDAENELIEEGYDPPKIGMFFDTSTLEHGEYLLKSGREKTDLTTEFGKEFFFKHVRDFYSLIPPGMWAEIDGRPVVWLYVSGFASAHDQSLIDYLNEHFARAFGGKIPYVVKEISWHLEADNSFAWGAALNGPRIHGVASVGPGYNDSAVPGRTTPIRDREGGRFYVKSWLEAIASGRNFIAVETWNEYHEGTDIAESREYGRKYIGLTSVFASRLKGYPQPVESHASPAVIRRGAGARVLITASPVGVEEDIASVSIDLTDIGGPMDYPMRDDGLGGDAAGGDRVYSALVDIPPDTPIIRVAMGRKGPLGHQSRERKLYMRAPLGWEKQGTEVNFAQIEVWM